MDIDQFNVFMVAFQTGMTALVLTVHNPSPKISVKISAFKGASKDNVMTWMLQVQNFFKAQGIENDQKKNLLCCYWV